MKATRSQDVSSDPSDRKVARLRVTEYDRLAKARGLRFVVRQAQRHGIHRSAMFRIRSGGQPSLDVAMQMAADLGTTVERLFELTSKEAS